MSFVFPSWSTSFSPSFHEDAKGMLEGALNKGNKPPVIQGRIEVVELSMGTQPPALTLLEIGDLSLDRFRGIFRLVYSGDAWLEVRCLVQANPLSHNPHLSRNSTLPLSAPLLANQPLLVPMTLRLSLLRLQAILILVVSASKGITLVFKNDPLQNVDVSSTFDSIDVIRGYLQQEIEGQLREMFREDLPGIIHRLSQRWFTETGMGGKVEMPYRHETYPSETSTGYRETGADEREDFYDQDRSRESNVPYNPSAVLDQPYDPHNNSPSKRSIRSRAPVARKPSVTTSESPTSYTTFPDIEDYDPTYGLRPEGLPTHSGYEAFGRLWEKSREGKGKGLGSLMLLAEEASLGRGAFEDEDGDDDVEDFDSERDEDGQRSFDMVDIATSLPRLDNRPSVSSMSGVGGRSYAGSSVAGHSSVLRHRLPPDEDVFEWETIPAVGGGTVSRPRILHSQSKIRAPSEFGGAGGVMPSPSGTAGTATGGSVTARASSVRSSVGGSTLGIGMGRSLLGGGQAGFGGSRVGSGQGRRDPSRNLAMAKLMGTAPSSSRGAAGGGGGDSSRSDVFTGDGGGSQNPQFRRRHSKADSVPTQLGLYRQPSSRLQNVVYSTAARTSGSSMETAFDAPGSRSNNTQSTMATSQHPPSRPQSLAAAVRPKMITTPPRARRLSSAYQPLPFGSPPSFPSTSYPPKMSGIVLPLNDSVSQLATLSHSNHTLSPYGRSHEHVAVRSFPHLSRNNSMLMPGSPLATGGASVTYIPNEGKKIKAKRKRIFRLGGGGGGGTAGDGADDGLSQGDDLEQDHSRRDVFDGDREGDVYGGAAAGAAPAQSFPSSSSSGLAPSKVSPRLRLQHMMLPRRTSYGFPTVQEEVRR